MITASDCRYDGKTTLADGRSIVVSFPQDIDQGPPWEECDGHGPIRIIRHREDKAPGERILGGDRFHLYAYDVSGAMALAKRDGWGLGQKDLATLRGAYGRDPSPGEIRARAVEMDANFLSGWINNDWTYVVVSVALVDAQGAQISADYLGGVESCGDYHAEQAAEMANTLIEAHDKECAESAYWLAREVMTA